MYCLPYVTEVVETVKATEVMGDSANVGDVVPTVMVDNVVSGAEKKTNVKMHKGLFSSCMGTRNVIFKRLIFHSMNISFTNT